MLQTVRGTRDIFAEEKRHLHAIESQARALSARYGFQEMETPIFESTEVFHRLGESSDVVSKETYTFLDRGGDSITLRPEGTAALVRAIISNGLTQELPGKYFYAGPMFRYDRPQKGRYRQFTQIGIELVGVESPYADVEVIALAAHLLKDLGILDQLTLEINTLGDRESRDSYRAKLVTYFSKFSKDLSQDSQRRLEVNPLRILDSKDDGDRKLIQDAPLYKDSLNQVSLEFFEKVLTQLTTLGIAYQENPRLVRGLDYYCHTAFEFTTQSLGAQGTVLAGGRYDGLFQSMGGPDLPGVGWAAGIERLGLLKQPEDLKSRPIALIGLGLQEETKAYEITQDLRHKGLTVDFIFSGNMQKKMKRANKLRACLAILIGSNELTAGQATVKNLDTGAEVSVAFEQIPVYLKDEFPELFL